MIANLNLDNLSNKKAEIQKKLMHPEKLSETERNELYDELSYLQEITDLLSNYHKTKNEIQSTTEMLEESDSELKEMAEQELKTLKKDKKKIEKKVKEIELERRFSDPDDKKSAIIEIRAGAGGDEASLFAGDLFRMYTQYAQSQNWEVNIISSSVNETGGYKEIIASIQGKNVFKDLKYESGVHRVQRIPTTESKGRIHTSTASVAILPKAKDIDIQIDPSELKVEVMRASGAGGQCVNKTDSAVRLTHIPTNIIVSCQETKYQAQNKEKAMEILKARLYERKKEEEMNKRADMRLSQIGSMMRSEKIRTYNFPQSRITDHRIKESWHNLEEILDGNLEEVIKKVRKGIQLKMLQSDKSSNNQE